MAKIIGAFFIIFSCTLFGYQSLLKKRETLGAISELRDNLLELSRLIGFSLETLPDAIRRLGKDSLQGENSFFSHLTIALDADPSTPFSALWSQVLEIFSEEKHLPKKAHSLLQTLGETLGKTDYQTESQKISQTAEMLSEIHAAKEAENQKQEQVVKSLSVLLGAFFVILLL